MNSIPPDARQLITDIGAGKSAFQVIASDEARIIQVPYEVEMSKGEADAREANLAELERRGLIEISHRTTAGYIIVKRLTWRGRQLLGQQV